MRKNEMLPSREESILSFTCSLCLSSACRSVTALFSFHLSITSGLLLVGGRGVGVTSHRSPTVERAQPLGCCVQTHSHGSDSCRDADDAARKQRNKQQQRALLHCAMNKWTLEPRSDALIYSLGFAHFCIDGAGSGTYISVHLQVYRPARLLIRLHLCGSRSGFLLHEEKNGRKTDRAAERERDRDRWRDFKKSMENVGGGQEVHKHSQLY